LEGGEEGRAGEGERSKTNPHVVLTHSSSQAAPWHALKKGIFKYSNIQMLFVPPPSTLLPGFEARVQRLLEYLNGRRLKGSVPLQVSVTSSSSFLSPSGTGDKGRAGRRGGGREGGPGAAMVSAHMPFPPVGSQSTRHEWLVLSCDKVHTHSHSSTLATVHHAHSLPLFNCPHENHLSSPSFPPFLSSSTHDVSSTWS